MTKVTVEQRILERLDQQIGAINRLAAAIEQQNAQLIRGNFALTTTGAGIARPQLVHYGPTLDTSKQEQPNDRQEQVRRVRPARG